MRKKDKEKMRESRGRREKGAGERGRERQADRYIDRQIDGQTNRLID